ncbi:MAG: sensor histidine kinase [Rickettsiales bacterium]
MVDEQLAFAQRKSINLRYHAEEIIYAKGNPDSLAILISNLIDNALRYTSENGNVEVALSYEKGSAVLRVRDDGPGIAKHERRSVFDRFYRIEGSRVGGTGLGPRHRKSNC